MTNNETTLNGTDYMQLTLSCNGVPLKSVDIKTKYKDRPDVLLLALKSLGLIVSPQNSESES
jgi:hypothetical protein